MMASSIAFWDTSIGDWGKTFDSPKNIIVINTMNENAVLNKYIVKSKEVRK
mgnify:CR=1 FL=1